jgi:hypothetical protein
MISSSYLFQDSGMTLEAGVAEYYRRHPGLKRGPDLSPDAQAFFRCHDVAHVIYGCGTSLPDEAIVKLSSIFGTTAGLGVLDGYRLHESQDIYRRLEVSEILATVAMSLLLVPRTIYRCRRHLRPWPWSDHARFLADPLGELRNEFGIRVAHAPATLQRD